MATRHPNEHLYRRVVPIPSEYGERRDADLPWGYWMQIADGLREGVRDEDGNVWPSLRAALWQGRLGMADPNVTKDRFSGYPRHHGWLDRQMEQLQAWLAIAGRQGWQHPQDVAGEVEGGFHYRLWLRSHNLTSGERYDGATGRHVLLDHDQLTDEGWAVYLMLKATRAEELFGVKPGSDLFETAGGESMADIANPIINVAGVRFLFDRGKLAKRPVITLVDRKSDVGRMPMARTIWSMGFDSVADRDRLFAWMCQRSDAWQRWGDIAGGEADAMTQHLLASYVASIDWREPQVGPQLALAHG